MVNSMSLLLITDLNTIFAFCKDQNIDKKVSDSSNR